MTHALKALNDFFGGFGLPAYSKNNVPESARMPYITYEASVPAPTQSALLHAWVWYRGTGLGPVSEKADAIYRAIRRGAALRTAAGALYLFPDARTPFAQEQPDPDKNVRGMYLTMVIENHSL